MTRAVLPNPSARVEWLFGGIIDGALHHWGHVLPLDGGIGYNNHADSETETAVPHDDDDHDFCLLRQRTVCVCAAFRPPVVPV